MSSIRNASFKAKLTLLVIPAILGLVFFCFMIIKQNLEIVGSSKDIDQLTQLATFNSALVHELQKERGASAGFIGSKGAKFSDTLSTQRQATDIAFQNRAAFIKANIDDISHTQVIQATKSSTASLARLSSIRQQIDDLAIEGKVAISYYTQNNADLINVVSHISLSTTNGEIASSLQAYYNFLQGKERAGIERAVMTNVFAKGQFTGNFYQRFIALMTEQSAYFDTFNKMSSAQLQQAFSQAMQHNSVSKVDEFRKIALASNGNQVLSVDSQTWFNNTTQRINQLKSVENAAVEALLLVSEAHLNSAQRMLLLTVVIAFVVISLSILLSFYISKIIMQQLGSLSDAITTVDEHNDLTARAELYCEDELGDVVTRLNKMLVAFQQAIVAIEMSSTKLANSSEQTKQATQNNQTHLETQQAETTLVATAIEQMSATVQEVAANSSQSAHAAQEVDDVANEGVEQINHTRDEMQALSIEMSNADKLIDELQQSSSNITSFVDVIKSVAEQTNLLALNAAIEAARAGEQGRGFAVVADEVRTLAQRTQESTAEIESMVGKFKHDAEQVSVSINQCVESVSSSVEQTDILEKKLQALSMSAASINDMSNQIAVATEEQVAVANEMAGNIERISELSANNTHEGEQIQLASTEQSEQATQLLTLANKFQC
ncbi:methyl-accepting chemotaxis protein [Litorilituus lipolyticus]|uniref:HAMP domain-containing protein n=1 Tax=Litorilituus lipolyticus TaxID=2491017 RepID=A0A502KYF4_9GAMM|nr:methyl-accepting chemotaxis protein [Litorilituus lipolyticus]TPH16124.1 HAMP domain-containing protein [Litorilituus lipolyticus]